MVPEEESKELELGIYPLEKEGLGIRSLIGG